MTAADCPDPERCPVPTPPGPVAASRLRTMTWDRPFHRVYDTTWGYDEFNPGTGDTRFAPVTTPDGAVAHLYGGASDTVVLLESVFHDVHHAQPDRIVWLRDLVEQALVQLTPPRPLRLLDLRDPELDRLGLRRDQLVTAHAEHYPCARAWSSWLHARHPGGSRPDGFVWHSRQAELADDTIEVLPQQREAFLLFGDRTGVGRGGFTRVHPGVRTLAEGPGRLLVDQLAEALDALVDPSG